MISCDNIWLFFSQWTPLHLLTFWLLLLLKFLVYELSDHLDRAYEYAKSAYEAVIFTF
jgi:hypothetical protein